MTSHADGKVAVAASTHPGLSGKNNEDCLLVRRFSRPLESGVSGTLLAICDGIGGHNAGEVASRLAVEAIQTEFETAPGDIPALELLEKAVWLASENVRSHSLTQETCSGMGSTCAIAWVQENRLYTATVGDSRIYLLRKGVLRRLSRDHSWVQEAVEAGLMDEEMAVGHPNQHVIRRYLGSAIPPQADLALRWHERDSEEKALANQGLRLEKDDLLLLCSDGLTDLVNDREIRQILLGLTGSGGRLANQLALEKTARALIDLSNQRGGFDNTSVILAGVSALGEDRQRQAARDTRWALAAALFVVFTGLFGGWYWLQKQQGTTAAALTPIATFAIEQTRTADAPAGVTQALSSTPRGAAALPAGVSFEENGATLTPWPTNTVVP